MNINFCAYKEAPSLKEFLQEQFALSSNFLKTEIDKKKLQREVRQRDELVLPIDVVNHGLISPIYQGPAIEVVGESETLLALNKPHQLHCHPLRYNESNNVLSFIRSIGRYELLSINQSAYDRSLLYRLDFGTSGILILVKKQHVLDELRVDFSSLVKTKIYHALVEGECKAEGLIEHSLIESGAQGSKMKVDPKGRRAMLELRPLKYDPILNQTRVEVLLKTGLRHQIRLQLASIGHPIVGDELYGAKPSDRIYLHAYQYSLLLNGQVETYKVEAPF